MIDAKADVDAAVIKVVLPQAYQLIDELLEHAPNAPKALYVKARSFLPRGYANSFVKEKARG